MSLRYSRLTFAPLLLSVTAVVAMAVVRLPHLDAVVSLTVLASDLDFGVIKELDSFEWNLPIRNNTTRIVHIKQFATSCSCTDVAPGSVSVPARGIVECKVRINTVLPPLTVDGPSVLGMDRDYSVTAITDSPLDGPVTWKISGFVSRTLTPDKAQIVLKKSGSNTSLSGECNLHSIVPVQDFGAMSSDRAWEVQVIQKGPLDFQLRVSTEVRPIVGRIRFDVLLNPRAVDGFELPKLRIPVVGSQSSQTTISPAGLLLGERKVGSLATDIIWLSQLSEGANVQVRSESSDVTATFTRASTESASKITVTQVISKHGYQQRSIEIRVRDTHGDPEVLRLPIAYLGVD